MAFLNPLRLVTDDTFLDPLYLFYILTMNSCSEFYSPTSGHDSLLPSTGQEHCWLSVIQAWKKSLFVSQNPNHSGLKYQVLLSSLNIRNQTIRHNSDFHI